MTEGSSAWELKQEHWDELKASKGLWGSYAENWSGASCGSQDSDLTFGLYSFSMTEQKIFLSIYPEGPVLSHHPW